MITGVASILTERGPDESCERLGNFECWSLRLFERLDSFWEVTVCYASNIIILLSADSAKRVTTNAIAS